MISQPLRSLFSSVSDIPKEVLCEVLSSIVVVQPASDYMVIRLCGNFYALNLVLAPGKNGEITSKLQLDHRLFFELADVLVDVEQQSQGRLFADVLVFIYLQKLDQWTFSRTVYSFQLFGAKLWAHTIFSRLVCSNPLLNLQDPSGLDAIALLHGKLFSGRGMLQSTSTVPLARMVEEDRDAAHTEEESNGSRAHMDFLQRYESWRQATLEAAEVDECGDVDGGGAYQASRYHGEVVDVLESASD